MREKHYPEKVHIAIYGAPHSDPHQPSEVLERALQLGRELASHNVMVLVPTLSGFPFWVAKGAKQAGATVIAFSPAANEREHREVYQLPLKYYDTVIYSGFGYAGADILLSRSAEAMIFGIGGLESLHEFWLAFQEGKVLGVFQGEWNEGGEFLEFIQKDKRFRNDRERIVFSPHERMLVEQVVSRVRKSKI